jgi:Histidine kinase-, DNA gyrase B-, and HSP90-like ATPase
MREVLCTPSAPAMMGSLRALGYSFEAALADIVDNSVAAGASRVDIQFRTQPRPYVAVIDDGDGMAEDELFRAMRHGGVGPTQQRSERDLGRFGLGLKTASLAQCRRLTVVTLRDGRMNGAVWDLVHGRRSRGLDPRAAFAGRDGRTATRLRPVRDRAWNRRAVGEPRQGDGGRDVGGTSPGLLG